MYVKRSISVITPYDERGTIVRISPRGVIVESYLGGVTRMGFIETIRARRAFLRYMRREIRG